MNDYTLLVFDWDGTLMDSAADIVSCMRAVIADLDLEERSEEQISNIIGLGLREAVNALYPGHAPALTQKLAKGYREHWLSTPHHSKLFPGAEETLQLLHEEGFLLAVATGKGRVGLNKALDSTGLAPLFHATRCSDETVSKPDPRMLQELMLELNMMPEQTLMIGDTEYDMQMANHAGTGAVAVSYGVHSWERLQQHDPLVCLDQISDINDWLAEIRTTNGHVSASSTANMTG